MAKKAVAHLATREVPVYRPASVGATRICSGAATLDVVGESPALAGPQIGRLVDPPADFGWTILGDLDQAHVDLVEHLRAGDRAFLDKGYLNAGVAEPDDRAAISSLPGIGGRQVGAISIGDGGDGGVGAFADLARQEGNSFGAGQLEHWIGRRLPLVGRRTANRFVGRRRIGFGSGRTTARRRIRRWAVAGRVENRRLRASGDDEQRQ